MWNKIAIFTSDSIIDIQVEAIKILALLRPNALHNSMGYRYVLYFATLNEASSNRKPLKLQNVRMQNEYTAKAVVLST